MEKVMVKERKQIPWSGKPGMPRIVFRIPKQMVSEFNALVVIPEGRSLAEVMRSMISEAIKDAKRNARSRT